MKTNYLKNECVKQFYEYKFIYNNQEFTADYCSKNLFSSYCYKDNVKYSNISFVRYEVGEERVKCVSDNFLNLLPFIIILFSTYLSLCLFKYILSLFRERS